MTFSFALLTTTVALASLATTSTVLTVFAAVCGAITLLLAVASLTGNPLVIRRRGPLSR